MPAHKSEIHAYIMRQIVEGALKPGDLIDEAAIATVFDVSKTPIREAILQLEARQIVEKKPRAGASVRRLEVDELIELIELHSELEGAAAYHAAKRATPEQLADLARAAQDYANQADRRRSYDLNLAFHLAVFRCSNNTALQLALDMTGVRLVAYFRTQEDLRTGEGRAIGQHREILEAIQGGHADAARKAMRRHAEIASDTLLDVISLMKS